VPIISGEIAEDFAYYLNRSEQINSAVSLGVLMMIDPATGDSNNLSLGRNAEFALDRLRVAAAGGFIIQMMPSADEGLIADLEGAVSKAPSSTEMISAGLSPIEMLKTVLGDHEVVVLEEQEPRFYCPCSRERALLIISALGRNEVADMLARDNGAELVCHFCNEAYQITSDELADILASTGI
jgi:molecular chaperone Hsp33